jgi:hypothetical protein
MLSAPVRAGCCCGAASRGRVKALPAKTRLLLLVAAADPTGDPVLVWRAAGRLGIGAEAATLAEAGLLEFGTWVRFRHPLVRSARVASAAAGRARRYGGAYGSTARANGCLCCLSK